MILGWNILNKSRLKDSKGGTVLLRTQGSHTSWKQYNRILFCVI